MDEPTEITSMEQLDELIADEGRILWREFVERWEEQNQTTSLMGAYPQIEDIFVSGFKAAFHAALCPHQHDLDYIREAFFRLHQGHVH